ncbi:MAG: DUF4965 domain-containing protein [Clostridia bacterium]|nr:DUF4965 domain-containing protein [Clostridia bacterium]
MKLRPPAVPLITVDPYFSVWSPADRLTDSEPHHWTGRPNTAIGLVTIDGETFRFLGKYDVPEMKQTKRDFTALSTEYRFEAAGIELTALFTTPLLIDDYYYLTRPISYLKLSYKSLDKKEHDVKVKIAFSEEICINLRASEPVTASTFATNDIKSARIGSRDQKILACDGDDIRINWGYFYISTKGQSASTSIEKLAYGDSALPEMTFVSAENVICPECGALFTFAYDDIESIVYFGEHLKSYWNKDGAKITDEIVKAFGDYDEVLAKCKVFDDKLFLDATRAGGEKYAEILELSYRQACAAHKLVLDKNGDILYISKECFSNGCAATVDVSYPSIPMFLLYNPELVHGMMRPIYKFSRTDMWEYDFAPHDAGRYPWVNGQVYGLRDTEEGRKLLHKYQMPVEECGNMLVMAASAAIASGDTSLAKENLDLLEAWVKYLFENGRDPENQLCTDDFAGHLAHNCNLSLKAISGILGLGIIYKLLGDEAKFEEYKNIAREMSLDWIERAKNEDGSFRLAFDREGTFSMKYNIIWDKLFGTNVMPKAAINAEVASYRRKMNKYGLPLDNRSLYTKSDWLIWTATLADSKDDFMEMVEPLWEAYNASESRVPLTDWYWTHSATMRGFRHRTVVAGHWIKLLEYSEKMKIN